MSIAIIPAMRGRDEQGAGYFMASRGPRLHNGQDFVGDSVFSRLLPGDPVHALLAGKVTKLGYPYAWAKIDQLRARFGEGVPLLRYVQLTADNCDMRYFYVEPDVVEGDEVEQGQPIGKLQRLPYRGIEQHYHFEVKVGGEYIDPIRFLCGDLP